ncbi:head completion/stabilization protein [Methylomagnum ishizawai]|uniref:head completion/stabilization protein n=1 Tax=Methylomagnum ishizawai TaxID=1760988 RepID=UPI001C330EF6|nr:head completion/stabilization protein [Methylomagnum ishizawai]BBL73976.1 head completion/stabilization protein [Methylomagnum ishizawai]
MAALTGKPPSTLSRTINNDGFWPDVDVRTWIEAHRLPAEYQDALILECLRTAMVEVNRDLRECKTAAIALGHDRLVADPAINDSDLVTWAEAHPELIDGEPVVAVLYRNAVYNLAKAKALRRFATIDRRPVAENEAKSAPDTEAYFLDEAQQNLGGIQMRMLLGNPGKTNHGVYVALL